MAILAIAGMLAAGCGSDDGSSSNGGSGDDAGAKRIKVTYVMPSLENEAFKAGVDSARKAAEADGNIDFKVIAGTDFSDVNRELSNLQTALAEGPDVIVIVPADPNAFTKPLQAAAKRAKIVVLGAPVPDFEADAQLLFPDDAGGEEAGKFLAEHVPNGSQIGILHCAPGNPGTEARIAGAKSQWTDKDYKIVAVLDAKCDNARGRAVMTDMLTAHPDLDAVYSVSDSQTVGAVGAIDRAGKDVFIVSYDAQPAVLQLIKQGKVDGDVDIRIPKAGPLAIHAAAALGRGESHPKVINVPPGIVDASTVDAAIARFGG